MEGAHRRDVVLHCEHRMSELLLALARNYKLVDVHILRECFGFFGLPLPEPVTRHILLYL